MIESLTTRTRCCSWVWVGVCRRQRRASDCLRLAQRGRGRIPFWWVSSFRCDPRMRCPTISRARGGGSGHARRGGAYLPTGPEMGTWTRSRRWLPDSKTSTDRSCKLSSPHPSCLEAAHAAGISDWKAISQVPPQSSIKRRQTMADPAKTGNEPRCALRQTYVRARSRPI